MKKTGPPAKDISSVESAKEFIEASNVAVIGFFKDQTTDLAKTFLDVAASIDDIPFGISSDDGVFGEYETKCGNIVLFKKVRRKNLIAVSLSLTWECTEQVKLFQLLDDTIIRI